MQKIKIEVGANFGNDTEHLASDGSIVYAFEPTRELLNHLWGKFRDNNNVKVLPFAVDIENGFANFKIAGHHDWGCSSLYDFSGNWQREDFYVTDSYDVPKITLYDFCNMYNINEIDYLWIDAQGNDFNCLLSLRDKINIVKAGQCEVGMDKILYNNDQNHITVVKPWLENNGFTVEVEPDITGAECNLKFTRKNPLNNEYVNIEINQATQTSFGDLAILPVLNKNDHYAIVHKSNIELFDGELKLELKINGVLYKTYSITEKLFYVILNKQLGFVELNLIHNNNTITKIQENSNTLNNLQNNGILEILKPRISVYSLCWNEEKLLPHYLNHYGKFAHKITIFDNESTDNSVEIIKSFEGCKTEVITYNTNNKINDFKYLEIKNNCWKSDPSEYVIVCDLDEFLYVDNIFEYLAENDIYDVHTPNGYDMVSTVFPTYNTLITQQVIDGFFHTGLCKSILFKPNMLSNINYTPGAHTINPTGYNLIIKSNDDQLKLLHYKRLSLDYMINRYELLKNRLSDLNVRLSAGSHYQKTKELVEEEYNYSLNNSTQILTNNLIADTGFWVIPTEPDKQHIHSPKLANWISGYYLPDKDKQLIDFGCGMGDYLKNFETHGFTNIYGFEGLPPVGSRNYVLQFDLTNPITNHPMYTHLKESAYNTLCLEVGEHIPPQYESIFLDNITDLTKNKIILSWALVGQAGHGHVNCLNNDDVIKRMDERGFDYLAEDTEIIRQNVDDFAPWFYNTLMIFKRRN